MATPFQWDKRQKGKAQTKANDFQTSAIFSDPFNHTIKSLQPQNAWGRQLMGDPIQLSWNACEDPTVMHKSLEEMYGVGQVVGTPRAWQSAVLLTMSRMLGGSPGASNMIESVAYMAGYFLWRANIPMALEHIKRLDLGFLPPNKVISNSIREFCPNAPKDWKA